MPEFKRENGKVGIWRRARKEHTCKQCGAPILKGDHYWEVTLAGSGLGSNKFPARVHAGSCLEKEFRGE